MKPNAPSKRDLGMLGVKAKLSAIKKPTRESAQTVRPFELETVQVDLRLILYVVESTLTTKKVT